MNLLAYFTTLPDADLMSAAKTAGLDLQKASETERDSEWHQSCFAAAVLYSQEMARRGLTLTTRPTD